MKFKSSLRQLITDYTDNTDAKTYSFRIRAIATLRSKPSLQSTSREIRGMALSSVGGSASGGKFPCLYLSRMTRLGEAWVRFAWVALLSVVFLAPSTQAGKITQTKQSSRLYTPADPFAKGGIHGRIKEERAKRQLLRDVFAVSPDNPKLVYRGFVSTNGTEFSFPGLPVAKYDLLLIGKALFYEGFKLTPDADTLTAKDRGQIEAIIVKSVPFFNIKKIHRCQGTTGRNGAARCVLQEVRTLPVTLQDATVRTDIQVRSIRLACLENVGTAGWQLVSTREIIRMEVGPDDLQGVLPHAYRPALGQIRVMDEIKELGEIDLAAD